MNDKLWLSDLYMWQRQEELLGEAQQASLANQGTGRLRIRQLVGIALSRMRRRWGTKARRTGLRRDPGGVISARRGNVLNR